MLEGVTNLDWSVKEEREELKAQKCLTQPCH